MPPTGPGSCAGRDAARPGTPPGLLDATHLPSLSPPLPRPGSQSSGWPCGRQPRAGQRQRVQGPCPCQRRPTANHVTMGGMVSGRRCQPVSAGPGAWSAGRAVCSCQPNATAPKTHRIKRGLEAFCVDQEGEQVDITVVEHALHLSHCRRLGGQGQGARQAVQYIKCMRHDAVSGLAAVCPAGGSGCPPAGGSDLAQHEAAPAHIANCTTGFTIA